MDETGNGVGEIDEDAVVDDTVDLGEIGAAVLDIVGGTIGSEIVDDGIPVVCAGFPGGVTRHLGSLFGVVAYNPCQEAMGLEGVDHPPVRSDSAERCSRVDGISLGGRQGPKRSVAGLGERLFAGGTESEAVGRK